MTLQESIITKKDLQHDRSTNFAKFEDDDKS